MISKPYPLTIRPMENGSYLGASKYIEHRKYSHMPQRFIRGFEILQKDLLVLFEYIEPTSSSSKTYSFRTYELLLRTCTEIEANFKSILRLNKFDSKAEKDWSIKDYHKVNRSHFLNQYIVKVPFWDGLGEERGPFKEWIDSSYHPLPWYKAYTKAKHDRANQLREASFHNLINAFCGLVVVLTAQFLNSDFKPQANSLLMEGLNDGFEDAIGGYFRVQLPTEIPVDERYAPDWNALEHSKQSPFQLYDYDAE